MSSEYQKYTENTLEEKKNLFNADVINFPDNKSLDRTHNTSLSNLEHWQINDKSNEDQLRAIIGICFIFGALTLMGLYSNLL